MELIVSLIMVPCVAALLMLVVRADKVRDVLCVASAAVIALLSIAFAVQNLGAGSLYFDLPMEYSHFLAVVNIAIDITVGLYIVCYSVKYRRVLPLVLAIGQILTTLWFEYNIQREVQFESQMHVDSLGIIMVLILGYRWHGHLRVRAWLHERFPGASPRAERPPSVVLRAHVRVPFRHVQRCAFR